MDKGIVMAYKKKYKPGRPVNDMADLAECIKNEKWFYYGIRANCPKHFSIIMSMTYRTLSIAIKNGRLKIADKTDA